MGPPSSVSLGLRGKETMKSGTRVPVWSLLPVLLALVACKGKKQEEHAKSPRADLPPSCSYSSSEVWLSVECEDEAGLDELTDKFEVDCAKMPRRGGVQRSRIRSRAALGRPVPATSGAEARRRSRLASSAPSLRRRWAGADRDVGVLSARSAHGIVRVFQVLR